MELCKRFHFANLVGRKKCWGRSIFLWRFRNTCIKFNGGQHQKYENEEKKFHEMSMDYNLVTIVPLVKDRLFQQGIESTQNVVLIVSTRRY